MRIHNILLGAAMLLGASLAALSFAPTPVRAAEAYDNCTNFIETLPTTIGTQGTWCLRKDLATNLTIGNAITVTVNNVTIDCNDFKIGDLAAGTGTQAIGIGADNRLNTTIRNCTIRGFYYGTNLSGENGGGHLIEDNRFDYNTVAGINVEGDGSIVRRNLVRETGGSTALAGIAYGIRATNDVDMLDNTVAIVLPTADSNGNATAIGIAGISLSSGSIDDNNVRQPAAIGSGNSVGIDLTQSPGGLISVRDNFLAGPGGTAVACADIGARVKNSAIKGFGQGVTGCYNVTGSNDFNP